MVRVFGLAGERVFLEMVDRDRGALVGVGVLRRPGQPVDVGACFASFGERQREIAEHVIEGSVLQHHDDDVLDLIEPRCGRIVRSGDCVSRCRWDRRGDDVDDFPPPRGQQMRDLPQGCSLEVFLVAHAASFKD